MNKLFKLKKWLTLEEAANYLGIMLGESVSKADVIRLGLDKHLKLSVNFVNGCVARPLLPVDIKEVEPEEVHLPNGRTIRISKGGPVIGFKRGAFQITHDITPLGGSVWDLPLLGSERFNLEHEYQSLTGGPACELISIDSAFVESENGDLYQIQERFEDNQKVGEDKSYKAFHHPDNYFSADLPEDSVFVVRPDAIRKFEESINGSPTSAEKPITARERNTLLIIIAALAKEARIDLSKPSKAGEAIANLTELIGARVDHSTIEQKIKLIDDALESRAK